MPKKNTAIFTTFKWTTLVNFFYKSRIFIATGIALLLLLSSCKKIPITQAQQRTFLQEYFEDNILNRDFSVNFASDDGIDITAQYNGYIFKLTKGTLTDGPLTATKGTTTYTGSWSCNEDYSKLVITLPASVSSFPFISREWKFTKKAIPLMELAPWGTTEPDILHMLRQ